jgi:RNA polymerase sigma-70 factor (ECF subfamily)
VKTEPEQQGNATPPVRQAVTQLLQELSGGNKQAFDRLVPLVYEQLRKLAARLLRAERPNHTLRATALVHEAYMHLVEVDLIWQDRRHFYAVAARVMRQILVDHARSQKRQKRGGGAPQIPLDEAVLVGPETSPDILDLDESLQRLSDLDRRKAQIVELLFFGGLTYEEIAGVLDVSPATVHRELKLAKAWLYRDMKQTGLPA